MGLFDYIRCKYPLPVEKANDLLYQSKDTPEQYMEMYEIREDGTLWHEEYDTVDRSDPNAEGLARIRGMATRENHRWKQDTYTGEICFYTSWQDNPPYDGWVEFSSYFVNGQLKELHLIENTRPKEQA